MDSEFEGVGGLGSPSLPDTPACSVLAGVLVHSSKDGVGGGVYLSAGFGPGQELAHIMLLLSPPS